MAALKHLVTALVLLLLVGCVTTPNVPERPNELERRAAFDMNCPWNQLSWTEITQATWGAAGCGRRATYVRACSGMGTIYRRCDWILNGTLQEDPVAPPATSSAAE